MVAVPAVTAAGLVGVTFGGYYAGKRLDKSVTEIQVLPDPPPRVDPAALPLRP